MPTVFDLVIQDLKDRDRLGMKTYGGPMLASKRTLLAWLKESYAEKLDDAAYTKAAILKLEARAASNSAYNRSDKGKARQTRYRMNHPDKNKAKAQRYKNSPKGKATEQQYNSKPEVKEQRNWRKRSLRKLLRMQAMAH